MTKQEKQRRGGELLASALAGLERKRKAEAEALRQCTGAVSVTVREERREADGTLTVVSEATSGTK
jgi:hypothetical protein